MKEQKGKRSLRRDRCSFSGFMVHGISSSNQSGRSSLWVLHHYRLNYYNTFPEKKSDLNTQSISDSSGRRTTRAKLKKEYNPKSRKRAIRLYSSFQYPEKETTDLFHPACAKTKPTGAAEERVTRPIKPISHQFLGGNRARLTGTPSRTVPRSLPLIS
ncbi:hypothetical protein BDV37DRAFT_49192 [Aspergillus pseudonomiae]|uniref:Uncharacterized protein n=1 Tax=Aspergillus pseudonomiae TaxID=1506151 RepID=A0A5N7CVY4_9EURO|nr:uncharacterized protein BDV37DRAFT_49192 [Aspergillus pseudonomiae]KAE8397743.1 hypothetical protein BDV37DRAFT_49192 [Aspergillus pseudonomiae]